MSTFSQPTTPITTSVNVIFRVERALSLSLSLPPILFRQPPSFASALATTRPLTSATLVSYIASRESSFLYRSGKVEEALVFSQEQLAPKGAANPEFLEGLEQALALLAFPDPVAAAASPIGAKLGLGDAGKRRRDTANELNAAILSRQSGLSPDKVDPKATEPALQLLLKELLWRQKKLSEKGVTFPKVPTDNMLRSSTLEHNSGGIGGEGGGGGGGGEGGYDGSDRGAWGRGTSPGF